MSNFIIVQRVSLTTVQRTAEERETYSLEDAAKLTDVHPDLLRHYCLAGLLGESHANSEPEQIFDDEALYQLRRIEYYRREKGVSLRTLPLLFGLLREIESLHVELRYLRRL